MICNSRNGTTSRLPNIVFFLYLYMHILRVIEFFLIRNDQFSSIILQNMVLKSRIPRSSVSDVDSSIPVVFISWLLFCHAKVGLSYKPIID